MKTIILVLALISAITCRLSFFSKDAAKGVGFSRFNAKKHIRSSNRNEWKMLSLVEEYEGLYVLTGQYGIVVLDKDFKELRRNLTSLYSGNHIFRHGKVIFDKSTAKERVISAYDVKTGQIENVFTLPYEISSVKLASLDNDYFFYIIDKTKQIFIFSTSTLEQFTVVNYEGDMPWSLFKVDNRVFSARNNMLEIYDFSNGELLEVYGAILEGSRYFPLGNGIMFESNGKDWATWDIETYKIIREGELELKKKDDYRTNTSRAQIVDENTLLIKTNFQYIKAHTSNGTRYDLLRLDTGETQKIDNPYPSSDVHFIFKDKTVTIFSDFYYAQYAY